MAKKKLTLGMAAAAAAGTAVYVAKKSQDKKNQNGTSQNDIRDKANSGWSLTQHKIQVGHLIRKTTGIQQSTIVTAIQSAANTRKTARAFIIPMVIMKLLPDRKSRRVWTKNMPIS